MRLRKFCAAFALTCALLVCVAAVSLSAQDSNGGDPPSRVARLNYITGQVSLRPDDAPDWSPGDLNFPLTTGYHLWADSGAHAEMHIGSTAIRLADQTAVAILNLDDRIAQLSLSQGALNIHIAFLAPDEGFEIDTPNGAVTLLRAGTYRIDSNPDGNFTAVSVRYGEAEISAGGQAFPVRAGQQGHFSGTDQVNFDLVAMQSPDPWDQWCARRDAAEQRSVQASARYVPREMIGVEDLGSYGSWSNDPEYGSVWSPTGVSAGWEPYREGHWAFVSPWGWTWIDDAPWGFAPFHYGRWAFARNRWFWAPGRIERRPVYAPALVAFVGGPRFGAGFAAWIPLGPNEVYRPTYRYSDNYIRRVNVAHVTNVTNINVNVTNFNYTNQSHVTVVPQAAFVGARAVRGEVVRATPDQMRGAQPVQINQVQPTRASFAGRAVPVGARVATPPAAIASRPVIAKAPVPATVHSAPPVRAASTPPAAPSATPSRPPVQPSDERRFGRPQQPQTPTPVEAPRPVAPPINTRPSPERENPRPTPQPEVRPRDNERPVTPPRDNPRPTPQPEVRPRDNERPVTPPRDNPRPTPQPEVHPRDNERPVTPPRDNPRPTPQPEVHPRDNRPPENRPPQTPHEPEHAIPTRGTPPPAPAAEKPKPTPPEKKQEKKDEKKDEKRPPQ